MIRINFFIYCVCALAGEHTRISAYQATLDLAYDTMFIELNATYMDANYDWNNPQFKNRVGESLNLAVNYMANVLHTLWLDAAEPIPEYSTILFFI